MSTLSLNVGNFVTLRLTPSNYPLWREQALALAESQEMVGHLTNEDPPPAKHADTNTQELTESFKAWRKTDRLLRGGLLGHFQKKLLGSSLALTHLMQFGRLSKMRMHKTHKNVSSHCGNKLLISGKRRTHPSPNTFEPSKAFVII